MAEYTQNYNLEKQQGNDYIRIEGLNENLDIIDAEIKKVNDSKVNVVAGKGLSANDYTTAEKTKLSGIAANATNYIHPANHPPAIITQDASNRFVTDSEKAAWNGKAAGNHAHAATDITSGTLSIARGGTGATTASAAIANLGAVPRVTRASYINEVGSTVTGELMWKNYGNNHTIFDASNSTTPIGTACNNINPTSGWSPSFPTLMGFNGAQTYGVRVDSARVSDSTSQIIYQTTIPTSLADGTICFVYE